MKKKIKEFLLREKQFNLTVFEHLNDSKPKYAQLSLKDLSELFSDSQRTVRKKSVCLFNGTVFTDDDRQKENALYTSMLIFDFDAKYYSYSKKDLLTLFKDCKFFAYETHSSNPNLDSRKWRVVIPLLRPITSVEYEEIWDKLQKEKHLDVDHTTKSINAIFYLPSHAPGNTSSYIANDAAILDPNTCFNHQRTAQEILSKSKTKTKTRSLNTDIRVSSFKALESDCDYDSGFVIDPIYTSKKRYTTDDLKALTRQPAVGLKLARLIGVDLAKTGISTLKLKSRSLTSVLPWHSHDKNPSMGIMIKEYGDEAGRVILKSFKEEDAHHPYFDLHYVYACQVTGKRIDSAKWTKSTSLVWLARALIDAGVINAESVKVDTKGAQLTFTAKKLLESMVKLTEARSVIDYYDEQEVVFSYSFSEIWSGISRQTTSKCFKELISLGVIKQLSVKTLKQTLNGFEFMEVAKSKTEATKGTKGTLIAQPAVVSHFIESEIDFEVGSKETRTGLGSFPSNSEVFLRGRKLRYEYKKN